MMNKKRRLLAFSAACLFGLCNCESNKISPTGFDAEGREDAFDKQTDYDNAETSKLNDLEQMQVD